MGRQGTKQNIKKEESSSKNRGGDEDCEVLGELQLAELRLASKPEREDVLFGRGPGFSKHNQMTLWKALIDQKRKQYHACARFAKQDMVNYILTEVSDGGGRFLRRHPDDKDRWCVVDHKVAFNKTSQALRCKKAIPSTDVIIFPTAPGKTVSKIDENKVATGESKDFSHGDQKTPVTVHESHGNGGGGNVKAGGRLLLFKYQHTASHSSGGKVSESCGNSLAAVHDENQQPSEPAMNIFDDAEETHQHMQPRPKKRRKRADSLVTIASLPRDRRDKDHPLSKSAMSDDQPMDSIDDDAQEAHQRLQSKRKQRGESSESLDCPAGDFLKFVYAMAEDQPTNTFHEHSQEKQQQLKPKPRRKKSSSFDAPISLPLRHHEEPSKSAYAMSQEQPMEIFDDAPEERLLQLGKNSGSFDDSHAGASPCQVKNHQPSMPVDARTQDQSVTIFEDESQEKRPQLSKPKQPDKTLDSSVSAGHRHNENHQPSKPPYAMNIFDDAPEEHQRPQMRPTYRGKTSDSFNSAAGAFLPCHPHPPSKFAYAVTEDQPRMVFDDTQEKKQQLLQLKPKPRAKTSGSFGAPTGAFLPRHGEDQQRKKFFDAMAETQPMNIFDDTQGKHQLLQPKSKQRGSTADSGWKEFMLRDNILRNAFDEPPDEELYRMFQGDDAPPAFDLDHLESLPPSSSSKTNQALVDKARCVYSNNNDACADQIIDTSTLIEAALPDIVGMQNCTGSFSRPSSSTGSRALSQAALPTLARIQNVTESFSRPSSPTNSRALSSTPQSEASFRKRAASVQPTFLSQAESNRAFAFSSSKKCNDDNDVEVLHQSPKQTCLETPNLQNQATIITPVNIDELSEHECHSSCDEDAPPKLMQAPAPVKEKSKKEKAQALVEEVQAIYQSFLELQREQELANQAIDETRKEMFQVGWDQHHSLVELELLRRTCESVGNDQDAMNAKLDDLATAEEAEVTAYGV